MQHVQPFALVLLSKGNARTFQRLSIAVPRPSPGEFFAHLPICEERPAQEPDTATKISGSGAGAGLVPQHPICYMAAIIGTAGPRPSRSSPHAVVAELVDALA